MARTALAAVPTTTAIGTLLPILRDPDGYIYYKEEVGGLLMGGFEPVAKPWTVDPIPSTFQFQLLDEDWDQFEVLMNNAIHRTPCLSDRKSTRLNSSHRT